MNRNGGFTFIEIIIAMVIITTAWVPVLSVFTRFLHFTEKIRAENRFTEKLISLDDYLRNSVSEIQLPYWIEGKQESLFMNFRNHLTIFYWKGQRTAGLKIDWAEGILHISSPDGDRIFKDWNGFESTPLKTRKESIIGVVLILKNPGKKDTRFICTFGTAGHAVFEEAEK